MIVMTKVIHNKNNKILIGDVVLEEGDSEEGAGGGEEEEAEGSEVGEEAEDSVEDSDRWGDKEMQTSLQQMLLTILGMVFKIILQNSKRIKKFYWIKKLNHWMKKLFGRDYLILLMKKDLLFLNNLGSFIVTNVITNGVTEVFIMNYFL